MTREKSPQINNLTAWMSGFSLSTMQKADAIGEFYKLLAYVDKLESQLQQNKVEERVNVKDFGKRLDKIFNDGNPTKALIIDAYLKTAQNKVEEMECECCNKFSDAGSQIFICEDCSNKPLIEITN